MTPRAPAPGVDPAAALANIKDTVRREPPYRPTPRAAGHKLNQNESPYDLPPALKRAVLDRLGQVAWNRYPEVVPRALLERIGERTGWTADGIVAGCGSNDLLQAALTAIVSPGDAIVAPAPTFALYRVVSAIQGGRYRPVPLGHDFAYDIGALIAEARRESAKAVILCAPNNPTGTDLPAGAVERMLAETAGLVLVDEAYQEFGGRTALGLLSDHPRLVIFRTFSKALGLAGLRFGYVLGHPAVVAEILKSKLPYSVNALTLAAVEVVLGHAAEVEGHLLDIIRERKRVMDLCREIPGLTLFPSVTNFFMVRSEHTPASEIFARLRDEHDILVRDLSAQPGLAGCFRVSVGTPADTDALVRGLRAVLGE
ncbi:MAG: pyridoxal phosphate-dependent aminotransferase [Gemmatimonadales bacterium]